MLATQPGANRRELCRRFAISPQTGYKWLRRREVETEAGLADRSRRPHGSPRRTATKMEEAVCGLRRKHPAWGGRKLARRRRDLGFTTVPAPSTIRAILARNGLLGTAEKQAPHRWKRFEHARPNAFWQMDFKGHFPMQDGGRCHPLTVLDDHSRFNLVLAACPHERTAIVQTHLSAAFRRYGRPERMGVDNGAPWGADFAHTLTPLGVWLVRVGVRLSHSRPYHPQTLGKDERYHRTLNTELIARHTFADIADCQRRFDPWRDPYNLERPHEALALAVPASRYRASPRAFPETLPVIEYDTGTLVRKVQAKGELHYLGRTFRVAKALRGHPVALRPTETDGVLAVYFCHHRVSEIHLDAPNV